MRKFFLLCLLLLPGIAAAQYVDVSQFPGSDLGTKLANAQNACQAAYICQLDIRPEMYVYGPLDLGTLALVPCANCYWTDRRWGSSNFLGTNLAAGLPNFFTNASNTQAPALYINSKNTNIMATIGFENQGVLEWRIGRDQGTSNDFGIFDFQNNLYRLYFQQPGNVQINSTGSNPVIINNLNSTGTGGLRVGDGTTTVVFGTNSTGLDNDRKGFKHKRGTAGCATAAAVAATCTTTVTWTTAFADANYTAKCGGRLVTSGVPQDGGLTAQIAGSVTFQTVAATAVAAQFTNIDCVAVHD